MQKAGAFFTASGFPLAEAIVPFRGSLLGTVICNVTGEFVAGNRGADFVKRLAPAFRAGTSHLTRLRSPAVNRPAACSYPPCSGGCAAIRWA